jgi:hypothetical protein
MKLPADQTALHRLRIAGLFKRQVPAREKKIMVANYIIQNEMLMGSAFIVSKPERNLYLLLGATNEIISLPRQGRGGDQVFAYIHQMYGLTEREDTAKVVYDALRSYATQNGQLVELRRFSAYQQESKTVYLSAYNGYAWKLDGSTRISNVQNGEEGVFFIDDDSGVPCELDIAPHGMLIDRLTDLNFGDGLGGITPEHQRKAIIIWMFALAFPDMMPTKPLLIIEGAPGSGKSLSLQLIQWMLLGDVKPLSISKSQEDDFGVLILRNPIALLDNLDSYIEWVADKVCSYTTTGVFTKRKLYSDNEEVVIRPHSFIAVASKNPASFRREDTVDRSIIIRLERRHVFTRARKMIESIVEDRPKLLGEYVYYVNEMVKLMREGAYTEVDVEGEVHRMGDYAALGRIVGQVLGWHPDDVRDLMAGLQSERDTFASEEDPIVEVMHKWISYKPRIGPSNIGREVSAHNLFKEFESIAQGNGIQWYKSVKTLTQKIRSPHIDKDFIVQMLVADGQRSYRIWRKSDAQLSVVPDEEQPTVELD